MNMQEIIKRAEALAEEGKTDEEIASEMELPVRGISTALRDYRRGEQKARIPALRAEGLSYAAIRKETGLSQRTIWKVLTREGLVEHRPREAPLIDERKRREIRYRVFSGEEVPDLASEFGISVPYVYNICKGLGRTRIRLDEAQKEEIARLFLIEGMNIPEIAIRLNMPTNTIYPHRFRCPIKYARWHKAHGYTYAKARLQFAMPKAAEIELHWRVWDAYNSQGQSYEEIAEREGLTLHRVRGMAQVSTGAAYRAIWELYEKTK